MIRTLGIDIETKSGADLKKTGVYKYVEDPAFELLLFAYSVNDFPAELIDVAQGEVIPFDIVEAIFDPRVIKTAHNAAFERTALARYFDRPLPPEQWRCTMVLAANAGLPMALEQVGAALKLDTQKDASGKTLIKYFCTPCKPTKKNEFRTWNLPQHDVDKWGSFCNYNTQDVDSETDIKKALSFFRIPDFEHRLWVLDQQINDRGVMIDPVLVQNAIQMADENTALLQDEAKELTGLNNPNSATQIKNWLEADGVAVEKLTKDAVAELLTNDNLSDAAREMLAIRQEMAKTSVKKYPAMLDCLCADNRVRGLLQFYGANRTGRWAGRMIQVQNLPRNELKDLDTARQIVLAGDRELLELCYGNVPDTLSQLIRTAFVARPGHTFIVADFSAIEARVIAWLAGEKWRLDVFSSHGKIYEASAAQMFRVPIESVTKGSDLRQRGKVAELALGYQGGPNALISMGALKMGLQEEELPKLVKMWRNANRKIEAFWYQVDEAAIEAVETGIPQTIQHGIVFSFAGGNLYITLPSGRKLSYYRAFLKINRFGNNSIAYWGVDQVKKRWCVLETYGGKLVENIVQAIARDCLAVAMVRLDDAGYRIVMSVHDEVVLEEPTEKADSNAVDKIMSEPIAWAKGLPLKADSYCTPYYKKD